MKKFLKKIANNIFIDTLIVIVVFILLCGINGLFGVMFRQKVYLTVEIIAFIGLVIGYVQIIVKNESRTGTGTLILIGILILTVCIIFWKMILLFLSLSHKPEHVIEKDNHKYVAYVNSFLDVEVEYYDYINALLEGNTLKIKEYYGKGGYDPFDGNHDNYIAERYYYYDEEGKVIKTNDKNTPQITEYELNKNDNDKQQNISANNTSDILYYTAINDKVKIKIVNQGNWSGKNIIQIFKTIDGGENWTSQLATSDGSMDVHYDSKFTFINENLGYICDPGLQGTDGNNSSLMVTTDGGKHFNEVTIIPSDKIDGKIRCNEVPYLEDDKVKLNVYTIKDQQKAYYKFVNKGESYFEFYYDFKNE